MTLEEACERLTARELAAYCWLWLLTPRFAHHGHVERRSAEWRALHPTDDAATDAAYAALASRGITRPSSSSS